jgi:replication factor A2
MSSFGLEYGGMDGGFGSYGGLDAMGGGGFMQEGAEGAAKGGDKKGVKDKQLIVPVTIRQVTMNGPQEEIMVDGFAVHQVRMIGTVESQTRGSTNTTYVVSDGTGCIEVHQYVAKSDEATPAVAIPDGALVKVHGAIKNMANKISVNAYHIAEVKDWNEMTHHYLTAALTHLQNTEGPIPGTASGNKSAAFGMGGGMSMVPNSSGQSLNAALGGGLAAGGGAAANLNQAVKEVYKELGEIRGNNQGVDFQSALERLSKTGTNISEAQLRSAVAELTDEGEMYTTIDEEHYAAC